MITDISHAMKHFYYIQGLNEIYRDYILVFYAIWSRLLNGYMEKL